MGLPRAILLKRLSNELRMCSEYLGTDFMFDPEEVRGFPVEIDIHVSNVIGYEAPGKMITDHEFSIIITEEYGEKKPEVRWRSRIFHPNIMSPEDGGYICIKLLNEWSFGTTLLSFIKGVEYLISDPNPRSPFGTDTCMEAAEYFLNNRSRFHASVSYCK
ncbi:MAG: ubiquitin-conjugating enzyme E2 [Thermoplasmatales archaeon]|jgi:ubiquitin-protein ligase|nr:ubiquitin-conjugating enzyme E2 [Thermoplasmatales archaeon]